MKTVLVIEDNENNMVLITRLLEKYGQRVLQAETGLKGCEMALEHQPDYILLDIQLPDIDGTEVLKRLRATEEAVDIKIIAVTSYAMAGDKARLLAAGCDGYIEKPINPSRIIEQIESVVGAIS
jgi:two-component system, cell cycle response regulator DivK